jgi:hypothetical protein
MRPLLSIDWSEGFLGGDWQYDRNKSLTWIKIVFTGFIYDAKQVSFLCGGIREALIDSAQHQ